MLVRDAPAFLGGVGLKGTGRTKTPLQIEGGTASGCDYGRDGRDHYGMTLHTVRDG